jgi:uncharacterized tellurite resistance protein B-like protein
MVTPTTPDARARFYIEVIKLLLQVATSDDRVTREEIENIIDTARGFSVPLNEIADLTHRLKEGQPLPPPDLGLLREDTDAVIDAVHRLAMGDGHLHESEIEMIRQIRELLGLTP